MGFTKLFSAKYLKNGARFRMGRRLLASEASKSPCEKPGQPLKSSGSSGNGRKKYAIAAVFTNDKNEYVLSAMTQKIDDDTNHKVTEYLNTLGTDLKVGESFVVTDVGEWDAIALSNYGKVDDNGHNELESLNEKRENIRWGVGAGHIALLPYKCDEKKDVWHDPGIEDYDGWDASQEAATLSMWKFEPFKHYVDLSANFIPSGPYEDGQIKGNAQNWARYLTDMPANKMTPSNVAQAAKDVLSHLGVKVTARDKAWIESKNMRAFLAVAQGSCEPPIFLECEYKGNPDGPVVLMAAKGVTFDSGGLSLKKPKDMEESRASMAGAAAALGAIKGIAELKMKINVTLVVPLCENMISGECMNVGDVVPALNGLKILIEDTDMEGRLTLADALVYGQQVYKPSIVIDVATLTPEIRMATDGGCCGCFSNQEYLWKCAHDAGAISGDRPWRFPLWDYYQKQIVDDPSVDLRNRGSGKATPCIGAAFLRKFVFTDWLHFDITGVGKLAHDPPPYLSEHRMSGRPTRTLIYTLANIAEHQKTPLQTTKSCP